MSDAREQIMEVTGEAIEPQADIPAAVVIKRFRSFWQAVDFAARQPRMHVTFAGGAWEVRACVDLARPGEAEPRAD